MLAIDKRLNFHKYKKSLHNKILIYTVMIKHAMKLGYLIFVREYTVNITLQIFIRKNLQLKNTNKLEYLKQSIKMI